MQIANHTYGYAEHVFKANHTRGDRAACAERMLAKYPLYVPVIVGPHSSEQPPCAKSKMLVRRDHTMAQLMHQVRAHISSRGTADASALFMFVHDRTVPMSMRVEEVFERFRDKEDGLLYVHYSTENTFG